MADIKNFSLVGVGSKLQFGKAGAKLFHSGDAFAFKKADEIALANVEVAVPTVDTHATTKKYVDDKVGALSSSRILDNKANPTAMVATDAVTGVVTIDAKNGDTTAARVATFSSGAAADSSLIVDNSVAGEVSLSVTGAEGAASDLRLVPHGEGDVVIGNGTGTSTMIIADDGASLMLSGGDALADGIGGDLVLRGGQGATESGDIVLQTGNGITHTNLQMTPGGITRIDLVNGTDKFTLAAGGEGDDIDLFLAPQGAGSVNVSGAVVANVATGVASTDAVNVDQLNTAIKTATTGSIQTREIVLGTATMNLGAMIKGHVRRVLVKITAAYTAGTEIKVGRAGAIDELVDSAMVDETSVGMYDMNAEATYGSDTQLIATIEGSPTEGAAVLVVEYIQA